MDGLGFFGEAAEDTLGSQQTGTETRGDEQGLRPPMILISLRKIAMLDASPWCFG
jgi:hypothetical protein